MGASTSTLTALVREGNLAELEEGVREHGRFCLNQLLDSAGTTCLILAARSHRPHIVQVCPGFTRSAPPTPPPARGLTTVRRCYSGWWGSPRTSPTRTVRSAGQRCTGAAGVTPSTKIADC